MTTFNLWSEEDLNDLDAKFDALCQHLGIEFVFERLSDGSDTADRERCYARVKVEPQPLAEEVLTTPNLDNH